MPPFEALVFFAVFALLAISGLALLVVLRGRSAGTSVALFEAGEFRQAVDAATRAERPGHDDLLAAARAARHLNELELSSRLLERLLADDSEDGEVWLELALTAACARDIPAARGAFDRVPSSRSDLLESLTLHRAWLELFAGDTKLSRRLFQEVEASISTKLLDDLDGGETTFAEWFLHAGWLWRSGGRNDRAAWALDTARRAAPRSELPRLLETWWAEIH
jgi:hypothetical protein